RLVDNGAELNADVRPATGERQTVIRFAKIVAYNAGTETHTVGRHLKRLVSRNDQLEESRLHVQGQHEHETHRIGASLQGSLHDAFPRAVVRRRLRPAARRAGPSPRRPSRISTRSRWQRKCSGALGASSGPCGARSAGCLSKYAFMWPVVIM